MGIYEEKNRKLKEKEKDMKEQNILAHIEHYRDIAIELADRECDKVSADAIFNALIKLNKLN